MYRLNLFVAILFLSSLSFAEATFDSTRSEFNSMKTKLLAYDFKPETAQKAFGKDLARLQEIQEQALAIFRPIEKDKLPDDPVVKAMNQMSLELNFLEELDIPVATGFTSASCVDANKGNDLAKAAHKDLYLKIKAILDLHCTKK